MLAYDLSLITFHQMCSVVRSIFQHKTLNDRFELQLRLKGHHVVVVNKTTSFEEAQHGATMNASLDVKNGSTVGRPSRELEKDNVYFDAFTRVSTGLLDMWHGLNHDFETSLAQIERDVLTFIRLHGHNCHLHASL